MSPTLTDRKPLAELKIRKQGLQIYADTLAARTRLPFAGFTMGSHVVHSQGNLL